MNGQLSTLGSIERARQRAIDTLGPYKNISVLVVDLDNFKLVNEHIGPAAGDLLLGLTASKLKAVARENDAILWHGENEFIVLVSDVSRTYIEGMARRIVTALRQTFSVNEGSDFIVTPSVGISIMPDDASSLHEVIKLASAAMRKVKRLGKNGYSFFKEEVLHYQDMGDLDRALRNAIKDSRLELHYQPQYDFLNNSIVGVESLVRWVHPEHGFIPPDKFIPFAEESGLIHSLGEWVLSEACRQIRCWSDLGIIPTTVSINVAPQQFEALDFCDTVRRIILAAEVDPSLIELELTERTIMQDLHRVEDVMRQLSKIGLRFSIDDFGTGHSSLAYISRLPIHKLKIDKAFVSKIDENEKDRAVAQSIINMGSRLGLDIVAEGVETESQAKVLAEEGCRFIQGYLISRPLPADRCTQLLSNFDGTYDFVKVFQK